MRVLILGGTGEARELAQALDGQSAYQLTSSLAGRVRNPKLPAGDVRIGGFGGVEGLAGYLRGESVQAVVDATHPFAATITAHAVQASHAAGVPLLLLRRPGWQAMAGDDWRRVPDIGAAAQLTEALPPGCVMLTTGRRDLAAFSSDAGHSYLVRTVDPPDGAMPPRSTLLLDRGPYTVPGESALMAEHDVCALVTKDSGGELTVAKLIAARDRRIPVIMVNRPELPAGTAVVDQVQAAVDWLRAGPPAS